MSFKNILLLAPTYPDPLPQATLAGAFQLAKSQKGRLTVSLAQLSREKRDWTPLLGSFDMTAVIDEAILASEREADDLGTRLAHISKEQGVPVDVRRSVRSLYASPVSLVDLARLHDLTIVPVPQIDLFDRNYLAAMIFDTGRPTLVLPSGYDCAPLKHCQTVMVAWDFGRAAARALADALPLIKAARNVHFVSVTGEKDFHTTATRTDVELYLNSHDVKFEWHEDRLSTGSISDQIQSTASELKADILVMGAYGHSRLREFVLGGATRNILAAPRLPIFLSH
jgi:nucleotide-binding universal stress UspA family protein